MQDRLVAVGELAPRTYDAYDTAVRLHLKPHFGSKMIQNVSADDLADRSPTNERLAPPPGRSERDGRHCG